MKAEELIAEVEAEMKIDWAKLRKLVENDR